MYINSTKSNIVKLSAAEAIRTVVYAHRHNIRSDYYDKDIANTAFRAVLTYCFSVYSGSYISPSTKPRSMQPKVYDALRCLDSYVKISRDGIRYNRVMKSIKSSEDATRLQYIVARIYCALIPNGHVLDSKESAIIQIITDYMHMFYVHYMNHKLSNELWRGYNVLVSHRACTPDFKTKLEAVAHKVNARGYHSLSNKIHNAISNMDTLGIAYASIIEDADDGTYSYGIIRLQRVISKIKFDFEDANKLCSILAVRDGEPNNIINDYLYNVKPESIKPMKLLRLLLGDEYYDNTIACNSSLSEQINHFINLNYDKSTNVITHSFEHDDLMIAYDSDRYAACERESSLHESCMKDDFDMVSFYNHSSLAGVVIAKDPLGDVVGRAILWDSVTIFSGSDNVAYVGRFMDRVYSIDEEIRNQIYSYCEKQGWARKLKPNRYPDNPVVLPDGSTISSPTIVSNLQVPRSYMPVVNREDDDDCLQFPYIDTLAYIHRATRLISNKPLLKGRYFEMQVTDGSYHTHSVSDPHYCKDKESSLYKFLQKLDSNNKYINA
jgi:hypothetical protein